ncbi:hypothetical protein PNOK_0933700 [Pyrrhoderma noxium]|uniref:Uncharacterized protein n=1 Tax=Pyrrhoderma noxium TaxID=2282107 RepID=A0A286U5E2_9AGAM|nr:hypothetical protein PNOK_0933700 [Pyrrhoderma noxium]
MRMRMGTEFQFNSILIDSVFIFSAIRYPDPRKAGYIGLPLLCQQADIWTTGSKENSAPPFTSLDRPYDIEI